MTSESSGSGSSIYQRIIGGDTEGRIVSESYLKNESSKRDLFGRKSCWRLRNKRSRNNNCLLSPATFLCNLFWNREESLEEENQLYRSESFRFLQKGPTILRLEEKRNNIQIAVNRKIGVCEHYAEPVDVLAHPELWSHRLRLTSEDERADSPLNLTGSNLEPYPSYQNIPKNNIPENFYDQIQYTYSAPYYYSELPGSGSSPPPLYCSLDECEQGYYSNENLPEEDPFLYAQQSIQKSREQNKLSSEQIYPYTTSSIPFTRNRIVNKSRNNKLRHRKSKAKSRRESSKVSRHKRSPNPDSYYLISSTKVCPLEKKASELSSGCCCYPSCCPCKFWKDSMARKRYETAFLPNPNTPQDSSQHSPDVDSLLLAIEATTLMSNEMRQGSLVRGEEGGRGVEPTFQQMRSVTKLDDSSSSSSSSPCPPLDLNFGGRKGLNLPMSEPLPMKKLYTQHHHHHDLGHRPDLGHHPEKRALTKENSISSLESLDSTKSDDLQSFPMTRSRGQSGVKFKILSPISDKSPLEPKGLHGSFQVDPRGAEEGQEGPGSNSTLDPWDWTRNTKDILSAAELTNVPWEMPKLRRKLALMADSGISLDLLPPRDFEVGMMSEGNFSSRSRTLSTDFFKRPSSSSENSAEVELGHKRSLDLKLPLRPRSCLVDESDSNQDYCEEGEAGESYLSQAVPKPDRSRVFLNFSASKPVLFSFDPGLELECQDWFYGAITRAEAEDILRVTREGSFLVRNCESSSFNQYSLSLKCARGFIHIRIEPNSLGTFTLGDQEFPSVPHLVLHFMTHRLPIKGAEHVKLVYPVINQLL